MDSEHAALHDRRPRGGGDVGSDRVRPQERRVNVQAPQRTQECKSRTFNNEIAVAMRRSAYGELAEAFHCCPGGVVAFGSNRDQMSAYLCPVRCYVDVSMLHETFVCRICMQLLYVAMPQDSSTETVRSLEQCTVPLRAN